MTKRLAESEMVRNVYGDYLKNEFKNPKYQQLREEAKKRFEIYNSHNDFIKQFDY